MHLFKLSGWAFIFLPLFGLSAMAQTPDGLPPSVEDVCENESGAAKGLCNAYCEAMDCDSDAAQASEAACENVRENYARHTGNDQLPCDAPLSCPDEDLTMCNDMDWEACQTTAPASGECIDSDGDSVGDICPQLDSGNWCNIQVVD